MAYQRGNSPPTIVGMAQNLPIAASSTDRCNSGHRCFPPFYPEVYALLSLRSSVIPLKTLLLAK